MSAHAAMPDKSQKIELTNGVAAITQLQVRLVSVEQLTPEMKGLWTQFLVSEGLANPYYDLEFTQCVNTVRNDVEIAVISDCSGIVGFFPFQRVAKRIADPVGGMMNDYHGIIGPSGLMRRLPEILKQCGLDSWSFHSVATDDDELTQFEYQRIPCPYIDLSAGFANYFNSVRKHSRTMRKQKQKTSKMVREMGPLRLEYDCRDSKVLDTLIQWKRAKYRRTKTFDILSVDWTVDLLHAVFQKQTANFRGILNVLWAGDKLVAAHMGLVNDEVLHYWFPVINVKYGKYSPGTVMFLKIAQHAAEQGIKTIDLGYGDDGFKSKWAFERKHVGRGRVQFGKWRYLFSRMAYRARIAAKSMPMKETAKTIVRKIYPGFGKRAFR